MGTPSLHLLTLVCKPHHYCLHIYYIYIYVARALPSPFFVIVEVTWNYKLRRVVSSF
jgi:hypothetical protein